jgi:methylaspartate mutase epsilon subunit
MYHVDFESKRKHIREHPELCEQSPDSASIFFSTLSDNRFASIAYQRRKARPYLQPRGGFSLWEKQRDLTIGLSSAGADFIPLTIDSHTRQNDYDLAKSLLQRSKESGDNLLNGYPLIAHGSKATRALFEGIDKPISLRHGTPDARLLVEVALDSGISEIEGGGLCYCLPYSRSYPIDRALLNWQYVDRLCALTSTNQRPIHRESFGALTATMVPPFMVVVIQILELLLAVEQGIKSFSVSFSQTGSIIQDLATANALRQVAEHQLIKIGYENVDVRIVYHQWMGAFPHDRIQSEAIIAQGSFIAALCNADKVVIKTRTEALGIPDIQSNMDAVYLSKHSMDLCKDTRNIFSNEVFEETDAIKEAANHVIEAVLNIGKAPLWELVSRSVRNGLIDIPFAPHQENANNLWTLRDKNQGIRVADSGLVPLPLNFIEREKNILGKRIHDQSLDRMLDDIMIMVRGHNEF